MLAAYIDNMISPPFYKFIRRAKLLGVFLLLSGLMATARAQSVKLAWNASSDPTVTGYCVLYGTTSGTFTTSINVGNITTATISNLTAGVTYYFTVRSYNSQGVESSESNVVSDEVTGSPTVILSTPGNSANFNGPSVITLSASAAEVGGSIASVIFYSGTTQLGTANSTPFTARWVAQPGSYALSAVAYDAQGVAVQSVPVTVTVTQPAISALQRQANGSYQLTLTGAPGRNNSVYVSSDLVNWTLLTSVVNTTGTLAYIDAQAVNATRRFYMMQAE